MNTDHEIFNEWYNIDTSKMFLTKDIAFAVFQAGLNHGRKEIAQKDVEIERLNGLLTSGYMAVANGVNADLQSELSAYRKELEEAKKMSMCELMTINASAKEYAEHWESRILKAEAERDRLAAQNDQGE